MNSYLFRARVTTSSVLPWLCTLTLLALFYLTSVHASGLNVVDDLGRTVQLNQPAQRIISLAPSLTENLFSAGLGERVVGTVDHSDYPEAAQGIPHVGNYTTLNIEAILALNPDLVVAWQSGNPKASVERLIKLGLTVFYSEAKTYQQVLSNIERLAILGGTSTQMNTQLAQLRADHQQLIEDSRGRLPIRVFYQVWNEPLITLNGGHFVSRAIEACGGVNIFADEPTIAPRVSVESVIAKRPQIIIMGGHEESRSGWQQSWLKWPAIDAVAKQQVVFINPDLVSRPTERLLAGTRRICQLLDEAR